MLIYFLIQLPVIFLNAITAFVPTVETLPFGLDTILADGFGWFFYVAEVIPPLGSMYEAFIWVIGFKITMRLLLMIPFVGRMF